MGKLTKKEVAKPKLRRPWYSYLTPLFGIKWGATVTLIAYAFTYHRDKDGLIIAAIIAAVFLLLEWSALAWKEFRGQL